MGHLVQYAIVFVINVCLLPLAALFPLAETALFLWLQRRDLETKWHAMEVRSREDNAQAEARMTLRAHATSGAARLREARMAVEMLHSAKGANTRVAPSTGDAHAPIQPRLPP